MNNFEFIAHLLEHKKLNPAQKERFLKLVSRDLATIRPTNQELAQAIQALEQNIGVPASQLIDQDETFQGVDVDALIEQFNTIKVKDGILRDRFKDQLNKDKKIKTKTRIGNPKQFADFMSLFNMRDGFKYLTHDFDEDGRFDIDQFIEHTKALFLKKSKELNIPQSFWQLFNQFALANHPTWSTHDDNYHSQKVSEGWSFNEWIAWSKQNGLHPIRNEGFKQVIDQFRRVTRVEKGTLDTLVKCTLEEKMGERIGEFDIELKNLAKADFYTNVIYFKRALLKIFEEILKLIDNSNRVRIIYDRDYEDDYAIRRIVITHYDSYPVKEFEVLKDEWMQGEKGAMGHVYFQLNGYCEWSVETKIENKGYRFNLLHSNGKEGVEEIPMETVEGFKHILTYYYK